MSFDSMIHRYKTSVQSVPWFVIGAKSLLIDTLPWTCKIIVTRIACQQHVLESYPPKLSFRLLHEARPLNEQVQVETYIKILKIDID